MDFILVSMITIFILLLAIDIKYKLRQKRIKQKGRTEPMNEKERYW